MRITGQLIDAATGAHLWADRFDGELADVFDLQDQVAQSVVGAIAPAMERAEIDRAKRKPTNSLDAYDLYLRGLTALYQGDRQGFERALRLFNDAIDVDPEFALAYARAAYCYAELKGNGWFLDRPDEVAEVSRIARRAISLGGDDAAVTCAAGWALAFVVRDFDTAATLIERALILNPNLSEAWVCGGWLRVWFGEPKVAIERFARGIRLNPLGLQIRGMRVGMAHAHFFLGQDEEAAWWAAQALQDSPDFQSALRIGAASNGMAGRLEQAEKTMARLRQLNPALRVSKLKSYLGPYRRAEDLARYEEGVRRAGLPE